ncbi:hypothetical protein I2F27_06370 [Acinetobacter sp. B5B]|uniref:hypothetical protein n=1 Tax=Acinetobacter TaxID=469 RepID=UPI0018A24C5A|nr:MULTISPECIES: hypothetical protein [Acinetobacter]MBF7682951.1 hypothetical protein [Acinetobacter baretiae]MBF7696226.1 hypothetical protein [Acinetobacter rathckeae]
MAYLLLILKFWRECLIALLTCLVLLYVLLLNHKNLQIQQQKFYYASYVQKQTEANVQAQANARKIEQDYAKKTLEAEKNYSEKIKQISHDARIAESHVHSLSKQLTDANKRLSTATREASNEYTKKLSNVFDQCVTEYRKMAERADGHEADAERLNY